jgi:hypothetical protein
LLKGRREDAYLCLVRLRRGAFSNEEIEKEYQDLQAAMSATTVEKGGFVELFRGSE